MKIAHMALWTQDLEQQARFWVSFLTQESTKNTAVKPIHGFESYFVRMGEDIAIELMTKLG